MSALDGRHMFSMSELGRRAMMTIRRDVPAPADLVNPTVAFLRDPDLGFRRCDGGGTRDSLDGPGKPVGGHGALIDVRELFQYADPRVSIKTKNSRRSENDLIDLEPTVRDAVVFAPARASV